MRNSVAAGFAPWIVFWVVSSPSTWEWASLAALVISIGLVIPSLGHHRGVSVLDVVSLVFFAVLSVVALVVPRDALETLENYAQTISMALLAVVAIGGVLIGRPFTAYYARREVPRELWGTREFLRINRAISLVWGAAFAVIAVAGFVAVRWSVAVDLLQWVVPAVAIVAAVKFTQAYSNRDDGPPPSRGAAAGSTPGRAS
ncbi:hypothetical protein [Pseudonocardia sp.]|uniref:hypothetical protein n=1 Tax=Pseudonocardia sp. TaxID=60912 RepID=UPI003D0C763E